MNVVNDALLVEQTALAGHDWHAQTTGGEAVAPAHLEEAVGIVSADCPLHDQIAYLSLDDFDERFRRIKGQQLVGGDHEELSAFAQRSGDNGMPRCHSVALGIEEREPVRVVSQDRDLWYRALRRGCLLDQGSGFPRFEPRLLRGDPMPARR